MKNKTTRRAVIEAFNKVIYAGYGNLDHLLGCEKATAYTVSEEGWAADVYDFGRVAIVTGYSPFGNIHANYDLQCRYEDKAREICNTVFDWYKRRSKLRILIDDFIREVTA